MRMQRILRPSALLALPLLALLACGDDDGPPTGPPGGTPAPTRLALSDTAIAFAALGDSVRLTATVSDEDGNAITDATIAWSSTDAAVATVSATGWVVAVAEGEARVVATSGTLADTARVAVEQVGTAVEADVGAVALHALGDSVQLTAVVRDAEGHEIAGAAVVWANLDPAVATVSPSGWVVAVANGTAEVVASAGELADTVAVEVAQRAATIEVTPASFRLGEGDTVRLVAAVEDSNGVAIEDAAVVWSSVAEDLVAVDDAGLVTALRAGANTIVAATLDGASDGAAITVRDQIAFQRSDDIYVANDDGTGVKQLTDDPATDMDPLWSPDGSRLAFVSQRDGSLELYVMAADGTGLLNLSNDAASDYDAAWSPDGSRLAFRSNRDGNYEIYVVNADGTGRVNLTSYGQQDTNPAWSPDGTKIAFQSNRDGNYEIYVMNADGSDLTRLTNDPGLDSEPAWSPDGSKILFLTNRDGTDEVYVMNPDGTEPTNLTNAAGGADNQAVWSPDGSRIAFRSTRDGNTEIYVMNADGSGLVRLTDDPAIDQSPAWSPTGDLVVYVTLRDGNAELYFESADGGTEGNLTNSIQSEYVPVWRPRP